MMDDFEDFERAVAALATETQDCATGLATAPGRMPPHAGHDADCDDRDDPAAHLVFADGFYFWNGDVRHTLESSAKFRQDAKHIREMHGVAT